MLPGEKVYSECFDTSKNEGETRKKWESGFIWFALVWLGSKVARALSPDVISAETFLKMEKGGFRA